MKELLILLIFSFSQYNSYASGANPHNNDPDIEECKSYYEEVYQERLRDELTKTSITVTIKKLRQDLNSSIKRFCRKPLPYETSNWFELYLKEKNNPAQGYQYSDFYLLCLDKLNKTIDYSNFTFCNDTNFITRDKDKTAHRIENINECIEQNKDIDNDGVKKACLKWSSSDYQNEKKVFRHCLTKVPEEMYYGCNNSLLLSFISSSDEYKDAFDYCMSLRNIDKINCIGNNNQDVSGINIHEKLTLLIERKVEFQKCYKFVSENDINSSTCFNNYTLDNWSSTSKLMERFCKGRNTLFDSETLHIACKSNQRSFRRGEGMTEEFLQKKSRNNKIQSYLKSFNHLCPVSCDTIARAYEHCSKREIEEYAGDPDNNEECLEALNKEGVLLCMENHPSNMLRTFTEDNPSLYHRYTRRNEIGMPTVHPEFNECLRKPVYKYFVNKPEKIAQCIDEKIFNAFERFLNTESVMQCIPTLNILFEKIKNVLHDIHNIFLPKKKSSNNDEIVDINRTRTETNPGIEPQLPVSGSEITQ